MQLILAVQTGGGSMGWLGIAPLIFIFAIFYFLLILPQQRRQKKWQAMLKEIKPGDRVITGGGITGTVLSAKEDTLVLRVPPDNIKIEVSRASIVTLTTAEGGEKS